MMNVNCVLRISFLFKHGEATYFSEQLVNIAAISVSCKLIRSFSA